ncbi:hypothetical protein [uncultured Proteiniphilum sp.]|uniref:hypothetical protein n=1 Tax=uncultured Proteiniphilum sp. TaxID=497637 RepID=UPI00261F2CF3|nr:hypothetical protein [uncultured Proteiniphilum sp.]
MKTRTFLFMAILLTGMILLPACGSTKGYHGTKMESTDLARVQQGDHKLRIKGKKTSESAFLVKVDTVSVGSYMKGFPKHIDVLPGERTVEIRHFQQWKDKAAMSGAMFGLIGASIAESNNPHTHYKLTFTAEKGKQYTILPVTDETTEQPVFHVIDTTANDTIQPRVVQIEKKKK